jgi:transcription elongation GreA/GreB family factor
VNIEKGIYSYRAPVSLAFMGRKAGDTVVVKTADGARTWRILEVSNGLRK